MLSVIIINAEIYERYQKYAYFFNWFEDNRDIVICTWNKQLAITDTIDEMVPQLFDAVKNVSEWNAYIVDEPFFSAEHIQYDFDNKTQYSINPYERARSSDKNFDPEKFDPAEDPLLKLVYFLGGRGVEELKYIKNYRFRAVRPTNIFLFTPRVFEDLEMQKHFLQADIEKDINKSYNGAFGVLKENSEPYMVYSDFWNRYKYPPNCRFMVFDMPDSTSTAYDNSWFVLWLSVMTVVLNNYNSSELGPYKLYRLGVDISPDDFKQFLNKFYTALLSSVDSSQKEIDSEIAAIKLAMSDTTCNHPEDCAPVYVNFPDTDFGAFYPDTSSFGVTKDTPRLDTDVWSDYKDEAGLQTVRLFKATVRGKNEAIEAMNNTLAVDIPMLRNQHLSRYDAEDIVDTLNFSEIKMLEFETDNTANRAIFEEKVAKAAKKVEKAMVPRVRKSTFKKTMLVGAGACLFGFIPFLISSAKFSVTSLLIAILITAFSCGAVALASYISLRMLRRKFMQTIYDYQEVMGDCLNDVKAGADTQSRYLTLLLNYMEKYQMLLSGRIEEKHLRKLDELAKIHATYEDALDQCKSIAGICHLALSANITNANDLIFFDPGKKIYLHEDTDGVSIPLNTAADRLNTPFAFVDKMTLEEEVLYEKSCYYDPDRQITDEEADEE